MDFIIMLVIFGVISSLTRKSKKPQGKRPASSNYPTKNLSSDARAGTVQSRLNEVKKPENLQDGLSSLFNMLAGEEVLKDRNTSEADRLKKFELEETRKRREQEVVEAFEKAKRLETQASERAILDENDILKLEIVGDELVNESGSDGLFPLIISPSEAQKGLIWLEILDKPISLKKSRR